MFYRSLSKAQEALKGSHYGAADSALRAMHRIVPTRQCTIHHPDTWDKGYTIVLLTKKQLSH